MKNQVKRYVVTAFLLLALAVILGAFGAHALKERLTEHYLSVWETANRYHFYHALGILGCCALYPSYVGNKDLTRLFLLLSGGLILFSGSLYVLSLADFFQTPGLKILGAVAPIGGLLFVSGWIYAAVVVFRQK